MYGLGLLIGMLIIFYLAIRDIKRQTKWIYKEYLIDLDLSKEKNKEIILDIIRNLCRSNNLKIEETRPKGRFPIELIKSFNINYKIQLDFCQKYLQKISLNPFKQKYNCLIVIFLGPLKKENISLAETIQKELDNVFS